MFSSEYLFSQSSVGNFFPDDVLANPIQNANWFEERLEFILIPIFENEIKEGELFIENGYAEFRFADLSAWNSLPKDYVINSVDIIFTNYPRKKDDWITNYYELLANRITELIALDEQFNSSKINYRLVLQTECNNGEQAKKFLHGVFIKYNLPIIEENLEFAKQTAPKNDTVISSISNLEFVDLKEIVDDAEQPNPISQTKDEEVDAKSVLYPESIYNRKVLYQSPKKVKQPKGPDCPSFTTRAHKPRRSVLDRIMRR
jgi:hypothetical protein